jgi:hypothetical protein
MNIRSAGGQRRPGFSFSTFPQPLTIRFRLRLTKGEAANVRLGMSMKTWILCLVLFVTSLGGLVNARADDDRDYWRYRNHRWHDDGYGDRDDWRYRRHRDRDEDRDRDYWRHRHHHHDDDDGGGGIVIPVPPFFP